MTGKIHSNIDSNLEWRARGTLGHGERAYAINEYYVIEGAGKISGLAGAERSRTSNLYNYTEI